jgi:hypothetical protein
MNILKDMGHCILLVEYSMKNLLESGCFGDQKPYHGEI